MWWTAMTLVLGVNPHLDEGRKLYEQLKYPEAEQRLKVALQSPANTAEEAAQISDLLARSQIAQGRAGDAERTWAQLLEKQPHAADPAGASPKIRDVFARAKRSVYPQGFVKLERRPAAPGRFEADLLDPWNLVATVTLGPVQLPDARHFSGALPVGTTWLEARGVDGAVLAKLEWVHAEVKQSVAVAGATPIVEAPAGPPRWPKVFTGVLAGGGLVAGGIFTALSLVEYGQVQASTDAATTNLRDARARDWALGAAIAFGGALLFAVVTGVLAWRL
ncbi:MAG: hypothetical protein JNK82_15080 [Myxococcaceae bacterium]|nr:hypothetical protein [Myxococcaceae bacterium]